MSASSLSTLPATRAKSQGLFDSVEAWSHRQNDDGELPIDEPTIRERLGPVRQLRSRLPACFNNAVVWMQTNGELPQAEGPMAKLFSTEALVRQAGDFVNMVGPDASAEYQEPTAPQTASSNSSCSASPSGPRSTTGRAKSSETLLPSEGSVCHVPNDSKKPITMALVKKEVRVADRHANKESAPRHTSKSLKVCSEIVEQPHSVLSCLT